MKKSRRIRFGVKDTNKNPNKEENTQTTLFCVFMFNLHQYIKVNNGVFCSKSCSFRVFLLPLHPQKIITFRIKTRIVIRN